MQPADRDSEHNDEPAAAPPPRALSRRGALLGIGAVAGAAAVDVGGFGYAGGWLRPDDLTPPRFADRFEHVYGRHDGFRRNHAKGLSATGVFESTGEAAAICRAALFRRGSVPVTGRFSLGGGLPDQADKPDTVRGLGLLFQAADGQQWRTAMINLPVFTDRTPQGFYERLLASKAVPATGKPDPQKMAAFLDRHPETAAALKIIKQTPPSTGFADSTFHGLNAFLFTNGAGATVPVRWSAVPQAGETAAPPSLGKDYLFDALIDTVAQRPVHWRLVVTIGEPGDPTDDATTPWPGSRRSIEAGTITITAVQTEEAGNARDVNFDPTVLPDGITVSDDPLLAARSAVYARSFTRRAEEPKSPSEVDVRAMRS
ncbi:catalase family peroxidase [Mycobacterium shigaense]|uniref:catalase family peroxidase n=1 Tax=Mycobacterium shigaense TaxID=722731 RepID=UPI002ADFEB37|nr:catalase family peroxidase [Mycobacterium shigaense]MEA1121343.1 catalase family peroxidase [Mycobacterium shigaense]